VTLSRLLDEVHKRFARPLIVEKTGQREWTTKQLPVKFPEKEVVVELLLFMAAATFTARLDWLNDCFRGKKKNTLRSRKYGWGISRVGKL
jgi:hypothetical protein